MTYRRYSAGVVLAAATALLGIAGCGEPTRTPVVSNAPPQSTPASVAAAAGNGSNKDGGALVKGSDLVEFTITMPVPKGAPAGGIWSEIMPGEDGRENVYYVDKNGTGYVAVDFIDCRLPRVQEVKDKPGEQGDFAECFKKPTKMLKGYPMILPDDPNFAFRALVVNHVYVLVSVDRPFDETFKAADVEEFLGTLDLETLAKL